MLVEDMAHAYSSSFWKRRWSLFLKSFQLQLETTLFDGNSPSVVTGRLLGRLTSGRTSLRLD